MKNVALVGILAVASLLTGCRSDINKVRNGYLEYNRTTTVGQALEHTFSNGTWKSFTTEKGVTIVEFDGSEPFRENIGFAPVVKMIEDYCKSDAGKAAFSSEQNSYDSMKAQVAQLKQQESAHYSLEIDDEAIRLSNKLYYLSDGYSSCLDKTSKQHANDPIPIVVQFSINHDGTFQYEATDMPLSAEGLFEKIYK